MTEVTPSRLEELPPGSSSCAIDRGRIANRGDHRLCAGIFSKRVRACPSPSVAAQGCLQWLSADLKIKVTFVR